MSSIIKFGLKPGIIELIRNVLALNPKVEHSIIYGSRAKGNFREGSDIDITLKGLNLTFDDLLDLQTRLDDLPIPYKVDLSIYHLIDNSSLLEHIDRVGQEFK